MGSATPSSSAPSPQRRGPLKRGLLPGLVLFAIALGLALWAISRDSAGGSTSRAYNPASAASQPVDRLSFAGPHVAQRGAEHVRPRRLAYTPVEQQKGKDPSAPPPSQPVRYRPVGCVRRGPAVAYTHGPARKEVALSFDDGPYPLTPSFVRMLRANGAVATFFMIGEQVGARYRATLHEELRNGDALGDHTFTHPDLPATGDVRGQLSSTLAAIRAFSGYTPCVFRPPYGAYNGSIVQTAASLGLATVTWNVDPSDYTLPGVAAIRARVLAQVRPGSIVLSHDGGGPRGQTLAAYPSIIKTLRARGYRFVTVPQLLGFREIYRRCLRDCEEAAISGRPPPGSIVEPG